MTERATPRAFLHARPPLSLRMLPWVFLLSLPCLWACGCDGTGPGSRELLEQLAAGQKQILERLDRLEKAQEHVAAASRKAPPQRPQVDYDKVHDIQIGASPFRGPQDAVVTLVEFSDFQCPYSQRVQPLIQSLLESYPRDLKHVFKHYPLSFHKRAEPAARACVAAGLQGKFWEMHAKVLENPKKLEDSDLREYAAQIGLNVDRFQRDVESEAVKGQVASDMNEARKVQVTGTPTLFLNGKRVQNRSPEAMKQVIDALREAGKKG